MRGEAPRSGAPGGDLSETPNRKKGKQDRLKRKGKNPGREDRVAKGEDRILRKMRTGSQQSSQRGARRGARVETHRDTDVRRAGREGERPRCRRRLRGRQNRGRRYSARVEGEWAARRKTRASDDRRWGNEAVTNNEREAGRGDHGRRADTPH